MKKIMKELYRLIFEDLIRQLKAFLTVVVIISLSIIPIKLIDDPITAISVVGIIVVTVLYFSFLERKK